MMQSPIKRIGVMLILKLPQKIMSPVCFFMVNQIATIGENFIQLFDGNHQSNTTKSRLNAILAEHGVQGECVFQKNFQWFVRTVQGVKAGDKEGFVNVSFSSGMILN
jgi:hypothetical protein